MTAAPAAAAAAPEPSAAYLHARLQILEGRVRALVERRRRDDPTPDDPFRGLYLSEQDIERVLEQGTASRTIGWGDDSTLADLEREADRVEAQGQPIRLRALARTAKLDALDVDMLLIAAAPDLDARFERLYGYLNDDVSRRRASVGLALELAGASPWSAHDRARCSATSRLGAPALVLLEQQDRPMLSRSLSVQERVVAHLLGDDGPEPAVNHLLDPSGRPRRTAQAAGLGRAIARGVEVLYLRDRPGASTVQVAAAALGAVDRGAVVADLARLRAGDDPVQVGTLLGREALLGGAGVVAGPIEALAEHGRGGEVAFVEAVASAAAGLPVLLYGQTPWEQSWCRRVPLVVDVAADGAPDRLDAWQCHLDGDAPSDLAGTDIADQFLLSSGQIERAAAVARLDALVDDAAVGDEHLRAGARAQNGVGLERLARRITPAVSWPDLVLPPSTLSDLQGVVVRARRRHQVMDTWGMRRGGGRGRGVAALFAGDSGTGKTMAAEVVAADLGLDLYTVSLATVIDKYIGETEKNLERIFTEAAGVNAVLLFDEADAIFGKRSEVRDAHDRYANVEVAYLLQRMESFDGIAILTTNLKPNVDDAFARRLDVVVDFPVPDEERRRQLWERSLVARVPRADDLDLDFCARSFEMPGGNIHSAAVTAAYAAADSSRSVTTDDLIAAIRQEYRKMGRLIAASEFGPYVRAGEVRV